MFSLLAALAVTIIGGVISAIAASGQQEQQADLNSQLMEKQAGLNRDQYDYEYSKESPAARVRQYQEAGLNPALMYSNGVAGMQGSVSGVSGSSVGIPNLSNLFDLSENMLNVSSSREKEGETAPSKVEMSLQESYKALTNENVVGQKLQNQWQEYENAWKNVDSAIKSQYAGDIAEIDLKTRREQFDKLCADTISVMNDNSLIPEKRQQLQNALKVQTEQLLNMQAERALVNARERLTDQQRNVIKEKLPHQINVLMEDYANRVADTQGKYISNDYFQKVLEDYDETWWNNVITSYLGGVPLAEAFKFALTKKP